MLRKKNPMKFDFFTIIPCIQHLPAILETQRLKRTVSNLSKKHTHTSPVVWLSSEESTVGLGIDIHPNPLVDKTEIKITIAPQKHYRDWLSWSREKSIVPEWAMTLERNRNPKAWWISESEISWKDIVKIENVKTGEVYLKGSLL